jgi:uncharacterized protein (TIGR02271 family)
MTDETIVAVFDTSEHAAMAVKDLEAAGVPSSAISQHAGSGQMGDTTTTTAPAYQEQGFWSRLFGGEPEYEHDTTIYNRSLEGGSTVLTVRASDQHLTQVMDILERHNPVDLDERAASYGLASGTAPYSGASGTATGMSSTGSMATDATTADSMSTGAMSTRASPTGTTSTGTGTLGASGEEVVPLSEEQLTVGKRLVNRGTTRVRRFVVETPVEEAVTLHSERVSVDRRPVAAGTSATDADFTDRTIEVTETDEEVVVGKTARVKEEVVINKAATDRVETIRDTVRREDVEVTRDGGETNTSATVPPKANPRV